MAQKLVKINQDHYVVVDDSKIEVGDWVCTNGGGIRHITKLNHDEKGTFTDDGLLSKKDASELCYICNYKKITHSTQKLYKNDFWAIQELKLSEVKELIGEADVEKKALAFAEAESYGKLNGDLWKGFLFGYNQALEDNKEKKYTEEDLRKVFDAARRCITMPIGGAKHQYYDEYSVSDFDEYKREILSAHTPTEWEIQIVDGKLKLKL